MLLDVASGGELFIARHAGVPAAALCLHGNNKSVAELRTALGEGVHHIVVDSFDELDRLDALHAEGLPVPNVLARITPGVHAHTHEFIATGQDDSKFGFNLGNGDAHRAVERMRRSASVHLVGVHCHIGSNVFEASNFAKAAEVMAAFAAPLGLPELVLGGGLGVAYVEGEEAPTITQWGNVLLDACQALGVRSAVSVEPGRSIVASAAITVYEVGTIKDIPGIRTYVSVDGGMSDNPRPVLYGSGYEAFLPRDVGAARPARARLVGKHCESGDILIFDAALPVDVRVGDLLATPVTGAYGLSMASNYNKLTRPPVVFAADGQHRAVVRRETYADLVRCDVG
jgi:diaminopimelate decarboxylase